MIGYVDIQNPARSDLHRDEKVDQPKGAVDGDEEIAVNDGLRAAMKKVVNADRLAGHRRGSDLKYFRTVLADLIAARRDSQFTEMVRPLLTP
jgi:hypothetical protein